MVRRLLGSSPHRTTPGAVKTFGGWYQFETMYVLARGYGGRRQKDVAQNCNQVKVGAPTSLCK
jgi:hypothetical protein